MKNIQILLLLLLFSVSALAEKGEQARVLVHTLNYISHDYQFAVDSGKIISQIEYGEATEFAELAIKYFKEFSPKWNSPDSLQIGILIYRLDSLIKKKAPNNIVSPLAFEAKNKVIAASGLLVAPSQYPNLQNGKVVYRTECAKCHGINGLGDGPEGQALNPLPLSFFNMDRMNSISPFSAFNAIRLGIEGTGMLPHPHLTDEQVWDVAFYISSFPYQSYSNHPFLKEKSTKVFLDSIPLQNIATTTDEYLSKQFGNTDTLTQKLLLAAIRLNQPTTKESEFLNTALQYLDGAFDLYKQKKYNEASQMAALSYLEGIEPIEKHLKASDPALLEKIEGQMQRLRKMLDENHSIEEISDTINSVKITIGNINEVIYSKNYSFGVSFLLAASVLLREGLEAFLIILIIISVLKAANFNSQKLWVHSGWIVAVLVGVVLWLLGESVMKAQMHHAEMIEGVVSVIAVLMLLYIGFWMHSKSEIDKWKQYVNNMMGGVMSRQSSFGLAALSFFVVFREVFESVLFLAALNIESGGTQSNAIVLGVVFAFAVVIVLAWLALKFSARLPIPTLFRISTLLMGVLAVVLTGKGIHAFQVMDIISVHGVSIPRIEILGIFPTAESLGAQLLVTLILVLLFRFSGYSKK